jgi:hypothetical protein
MHPPIEQRGHLIINSGWPSWCQDEEERDRVLWGGGLIWGRVRSGPPCAANFCSSTTCGAGDQCTWEGWDERLLGVEFKAWWLGHMDQLPEVSSLVVPSFFSPNRCKLSGSGWCGLPKCATSRGTEAEKGHRIKVSPDEENAKTWFGEMF